MASTALAVTKFLEVLMPIIGFSYREGTLSFKDCNRLLFVASSASVFPFDFDESLNPVGRPYSPFGGPK